MQPDAKHEDEESVVDPDSRFFIPLGEGALISIRFEQGAQLALLAELIATTGGRPREFSRHYSTTKRTWWKVYARLLEDDLIVGPPPEDFDETDGPDDFIPPLVQLTELGSRLLAAYKAYLRLTTTLVPPGLPPRTLNPGPLGPSCTS